MRHFVSKSRTLSSRKEGLRVLCISGQAIDSQLFFALFRLLVATPWWQNIVTVTWYRFRQVLTNVIGWQSQVHTLLSVTAWALEANTKVGHSITIRLSDIPVYSWSHHFMQILNKLVKLNVSTDQTIFLRYAADRIYIGNVKYVALATLVHCCQCWFSVSQRSP